MGVSDRKLSSVGRVAFFANFDREEERAVAWNQLHLLESVDLVVVSLTRSRSDFEVGYFLKSCNSCSVISDQCLD